MDACYDLSVLITLSTLDESGAARPGPASPSAHRDVVRARIVLAAADGRPTPRSPPISGCTSTPSANGVAASPPRLAGLEDRPRAGGHACSRRPGRRGQGAGLRAARRDGLPLARWSAPIWPPRPSPAGWPSVSASTVRRWLAADAIKPWQHRSWIFPRDPDFGIKAARVLDLYARSWQGQQLGADEYVISADEKSNSKPCGAATADNRRDPGGPDASSSSTAAAAPWPTSPPTTSTTPGCSAGSHRRPASSRSPSWSTR